MWAFGLLAAAGLLVFVEWRRSGRGGYDFLVLQWALVYSRLWHRWSCDRPAPLPATGPVLVIANHTCSADPNFLQAGCRRILSYLVAQEHFDVHPLARWLLDYLDCVPVARHGRDWLALRRTLRRLEQGAVVCLFPEGNLSGVSKDRLLPGKPGSAYLALRSRAPIYPAYITGGPRTENLLDSWLWPSRRAVRVHFGPAIDLTAYYGRPISRALIEEVTQVLMARISACVSRSLVQS